tara:strand:+ start:942 stop:1193 length:252 start_codon:yes stop_codon:yes gene_type:complete
MKTKDKLIRDLALEIEAENVAREVPMLTLECEYMFSLLRECHDLLACIEGDMNNEPFQCEYTLKDVTSMLNKIEKLEDNIKQK